MRLLIGTTVALAMALLVAMIMNEPAQAQYYRYHGYYGRNCYWTGCCPPGMTIQGGVCKPYRYGPWDYHPYYQPYRNRYYGYQYW